MALARAFHNRIETPLYSCSFLDKLSITKLYSSIRTQSHLFLAMIIVLGDDQFLDINPRQVVLESFSPFHEPQKKHHQSPSKPFASML